MRTPAPAHTRGLTASAQANSAQANSAHAKFGVPNDDEFESDSKSWNELADEELISLYRKTNNRKVFECLILRYEHEIFSYLRRYIGHTEMAEDAFQGTFLQVHLKCQQFDSTRRFRPWLYAIATNQAIDVGRRNKRHRMVSLDQTHPADHDQRASSWGEKLVGTTPDPHVVAQRAEDGRWIDRAVESLGEPMQQVIQLIYYQGLKYREAAEALGIPVGTVKSRLHAAVNRLSLLWDETHGKTADPHLASSDSCSTWENH